MFNKKMCVAPQRQQLKLPSSSTYCDLFFFPYIVTVPGTCIVIIHVFYILILSYELLSYPGYLFLPTPSKPGKGIVFFTGYHTTPFYFYFYEQVF